VRGMAFILRDVRVRSNDPPPARCGRFVQQCGLRAR
jgi:hypothetical protein